MRKARNILDKISEAGLVGRGGAAYQTAEKWTAIKDSLRNRKIGYMVVNGAEGEPGVKKDGYILAHFPEEIIRGVFLADNFFGAKKIKKVYFFLNPEYVKKYAGNLQRILNQKKYQALLKKTAFVTKPKIGAYISGEETTLLNILEGKRTVPRVRPPYPPEHGLFGHPTLINNVETFYNVSLVESGRYQEKRFYTLSGALKHPGVYCLPASLTVEDVLRESHNWPTDPFFVQVGGEASGEILNSDQLMHPVEGAGSIMVYN